MNKLFIAIQSTRIAQAILGFVKRNDSKELVQEVKFKLPQTVTHKMSKELDLEDPITVKALAAIALINNRAESTNEIEVGDFESRKK